MLLKSFFSSKSIQLKITRSCVCLYFHRLTRFAISLANIRPVALELERKTSPTILFAVPPIQSPLQRGQHGNLEKAFSGRTEVCDLMVGD